jgi:uroporphyrinogen-III synthase
MITFTSGSTVTNFFKMDINWPDRCEAACIGPVTHKNFKSHCEAASIESKKHDIDGLVQAILDHFAK